MTDKRKILQVSKNDFTKTKIVEENLPKLQANQILLEVEKFGFTANNITYALLGEQLRYWNFFPVDDNWGIIPVWGIAKVIASEQAAIPVGKPYYGYFPMASHLVVEAGKVRPPHFIDIAAHRSNLPVIYNTYMDAQAAFGGKQEEIQLIFRPLFTTSFLLDDFLTNASFFQAEQLVLSSASSKTSMGLAMLLQARKKSENSNYQVVGLTSERNLSFVQSLGYYDQVYSYEELEQISLSSTCIVDFSGNAPVLYRLQEHLQVHLLYSCLVGVSHWDQRGIKTANTIKGEVFFAPTYAQKRLKEWGFLGFQSKLQRAWEAFYKSNQGALEIKNIETMQTIQEAYLKTLAGDISPKVGLIMRP